MNENHRTPSQRLTFEDAVMIHRRIFAREFQSRIDADYDMNQGRVAEIKKGDLFPGSREAALGQLWPN